MSSDVTYKKLGWPGFTVLDGMLPVSDGAWGSEGDYVLVVYCLFF